MATDEEIKNYSSCRFSGKSVFITGASGFIGSHIVRALIEQGAEVSVLLRPESSAWRLEGQLDYLKIFEGDLSDTALLHQIIARAKPKYLLHLAAYTQVGRDLSHADRALEVNLLGTINLLRALPEPGVSRIVISGSSEEYGNSKPPVSEEEQLKPVSPYSASKAAVTLWCQMLHRTLGLPVVILRPFLIYGPMQDSSRMIPQAILAALKGQDFPMTSGEQTREYTYIQDIVDAYLRAAALPDIDGEVLNIGCGVDYQLLNMAQMIYAMCDASGSILPGAYPYRKAELWRHCSDSTKAYKLLGWEPNYTLEQGLQETIAWYRKHQELLAELTRAENDE